ncbi:SDR family oxidoreductase [Azospirillum rugosum]|uniref:NAD(P)-dependent dehydrogenase (Short-subunit alcohol dehydrogenase family) n=1 Tax=Azospirillum rugosum TaxID=416170 RepID=A0ABS4SWR6_9PROT|nr:SDR family oxidoreductase [Azospirillum rugosum]MBP2297001.1 NAD(P)-dependent dehydrogenase (short-subunit alcohol dehydrogenase family) [Azospirillum rugosum]MDQ0530633.1 NAD(P)-dependent dehydrogenase (short-subunit alcohol dehydrogenase family) [Azospirillum rugosum]
MTGTVLITGCSTGFGEATARLFAARGWNVVATMRRPEAGADLAALDNVLVTRLDVQDPASIDAAVAAAVERFGRVDVLVNNAGFGLFGVFESTPRAKVQEQFDVNVFGVMDVTRALLPHFRANRSGVIVNVSSGAGVFALPMISLYCASKFALEGFSESLSYELADLGIAVKIVEPGGVTSTSFGQRSGLEASQGAVPPDYEPFVAAANEVFAGLRASRADATSEEVAEVIFTAATDGTDRLRYVATEDIKPLVAARRETSEADYLAFMRARVAPRVKR